MQSYSYRLLYNSIYFCNQRSWFIFAIKNAGLRYFLNLEVLFILIQSLTYSVTTYPSFNLTYLKSVSQVNSSKVCVHLLFLHNGDFTRNFMESLMSTVKQFIYYLFINLFMWILWNCRLVFLEFSYPFKFKCITVVSVGSQSSTVNLPAIHIYLLWSRL